MHSWDKRFLYLNDFHLIRMGIPLNILWFYLIRTGGSIKYGFHLIRMGIFFFYGFHLIRMRFIQYNFHLIRTGDSTINYHQVTSCECRNQDGGLKMRLYWKKILHKIGISRKCSCKSKMSTGNHAEHTLGRGLGVWGRTWEGCPEDKLTTTFFWKSIFSLRGK